MEENNYPAPGKPRGRDYTGSGALVVLLGVPRFWNFTEKHHPSSLRWKKMRRAPLEQKKERFQWKVSSVEGDAYMIKELISELKRSGFLRENLPPAGFLLLLQWSRVE